MPTTDFTPVSWNGEPITTAKLNQMCNNTQYLFNHSSSFRYSANGLVRDSALKLISGKTPFPTNTANYLYVYVYFGSYFSTGCKPVVNVTIEATASNMHRATGTVTGLNAELDQSGFRVIVQDPDHTQIYSGGWVHWTAVGY